ncbi:unnamed protein product [Cladocopium goreaui]|uniref:Uncharacterized protein n=1 Tax=Cladocopium goreaui TaxID=2562237 RepID=A0A9P1CD79_9DINO|nr:unnamed protein product [Cladocopium goreaui]
MALAKFSEDLAKALKEQGTPVESALVSPEDTPVAKTGEGPSNFGFWAHLGLSSASSSSTGSPPSPREAERSGRSWETGDEAPRFLFGSACLRPHTEGSLGSRTLEERVESGRRLKAAVAAMKAKELPSGETSTQRSDAASSLMRSAAAAVSSPSKGRTGLPEVADLSHAEMAPG